MKKVSYTLGLMIPLSTLISPGKAQNESSFYVATAPATSVQNSQIEGTIESINSSGSEFVIADDLGQRTRFRVKPGTLITGPEGLLSADSLKPGDTVSMMTDGNGDVSRMAIVPSGH